MLEGEHRTGDKRLSELVAEVGSTIRCLDKNLLRSLIEPFAHGHDVLPVALDVAACRRRPSDEDKQSCTQQYLR